MVVRGRSSSPLAESVAQCCTPPKAGPRVPSTRQRLRFSKTEADDPADLRSNRCCGPLAARVSATAAGRPFVVRITRRAALRTPPDWSPAATPGCRGSCHCRLRHGLTGRVGWSLERGQQNQRLHRTFVDTHTSPVAPIRTRGRDVEGDGREPRVRVRPPRHDRPPEDVARRGVLRARRLHDQHS